MGRGEEDRCRRSRPTCRRSLRLVVDAHGWVRGCPAICVWCDVCLHCRHHGVRRLDGAHSRGDCWVEHILCRMLRLSWLLCHGNLHHLLGTFRARVRVSAPDYGLPTGAARTRPTLLLLVMVI